MKKVFLLLLVILHTAPDVIAQYYTNENKVWTFGNLTGLNFTTGVPVADSSQIYSVEGVASVCDATGNLLFYSDGKYIRNKTHNTMPLGANIVTYYTASTTQSSAIVRTIANANQYYVFSLETQKMTNFACHLAYSLVDMTLDGGMGDLLPSAVGIEMASMLGEKMITIPGDNCNMWLLTHRYDMPRFEAYEITSTGLNLTPVLSTAGTRSTYYSGVIKVSHDRQTIVNQNNTVGATCTELYDFDPATGMVSNCRVLDTVSKNYGAEFSPDNTKLYVSEITPTHYLVAQYDLSMPTTAAIISSKVTVVSAPFSPGELVRDLRLGPDGKIYFASIPQGSRDFLDCISNPNAVGIACGYVSNAVSLAPHYYAYGFSGLFWSFQVPAAISGTTTLCQGTTAYLSNGVSGGTWTSSNSGVATVDSTTGLVTAIGAGSTSIAYTINSCQALVTFTVGIGSAGIITGVDTICAGTGYAVALSDSITGGRWRSSNTAIAIVDSIRGMLTGIVAGNVTVTYSVTHSCGTVTATKSVYIRSAAQCAAGVLPPIETPNKLTITPNPNHGIFAVTLESRFDEEMQIEIVHVTGKKIRDIITVTNKRNEIKLDGLKGLYMLFVTTAHGRYSAKILAE